MPPYTYSQIRIPETEHEILVPQLFPYASSTGEILPGEIENWVKTGTIPSHLYEMYAHDIQKEQEIRERMRKGDIILQSELPQAPWKLAEFMLKNKATLYGERVLSRIFSPLNENDLDIVYLSFVKEAMTCIASQDPLPIHFLVSKKILKEKFSTEDSLARDLLARELVESCHKILEFSIFQHKAFDKNPIDIEDLNDHLRDTQKPILQIDAEFIVYLKTLGKSGKERAEYIERIGFENYRCYESQNYSPNEKRKVWGLWIPHNNGSTNLALEYLAKALWEDKCFKPWNCRITGYPSLVKPLVENLIPILSPERKNFVEKGENIICSNQKGEPLLMAPAVDVNMISALQRGIRELSTLTGHKILRWEVNTGFEKWQSGDIDPRYIEIDGGYSKIAELAECKSPKEIAKIRDILHAQAFGKFIIPGVCTDNMITLSIAEKYRNSEPSKIQIVLGTMLMPPFVHLLQGSNRRLIPIGPLPPLCGSPNNHAAQAQLQLHVFAEFSNQSDRLAQQGSVLIPSEKWEKMARESGLQGKVEHVRTHWCQPDFFNCFLEKQGDEYRLASYYDKAHKFLESQGQRRISNSERGKQSVAKKEKGHKKFKVT